jgi:hypothetical protein
VKELRLAGISSVEQGNAFLAEHFVDAFNRRYRVEPRSPADVHRPLDVNSLAMLPETLCRIAHRQVMGDFTVSFQSSWYQILPTTGLAIRPKDAVLVRQYTDGKISFTIRNKRVDTKLVAKQPLHSPHPPHRADAVCCLR